MDKWLLDYTAPCPSCDGMNVRANLMNVARTCERCHGPGRILNEAGLGLARLLNSTIFRLASSGQAAHPGTY